MVINPLETLAPSFILAAGSIAAEPLAGWLTNSLFVAVIVVGIILIFTRMATSRMEMIPGGKQNLVEFVVEFLYGQVEEILGAKVAKRAFPLLATIFIFVLVSNWFGLIPGVGTIGIGEKSGPLTLDEHAGHFTPLLRPATADLNMTLGIALVFMLVWFYISARETGIGFITHLFAPKGGLTGVLKWALVPIFLFVGVIEVISIVFRPLSLSFRLFGNIYAGETLLHTMSHMAEGAFGSIGSFVLDVLLPLPFYFMEILVGFLQAMVFALLCAVYIQLATSHDEEEH